METKNTERLPQEGNISQVPGTAAFATWLLMPIGFLSMATLCLWMGALMSVRCERAPSASGDLSDATHVSVTVERRLLGLIPIYRTTLPDVVGVGSVHGPTRLVRQGRTGDIGAVLTLRLADGRTWNSPPAYAPFGTPPWHMGKQIAKFIEDPSAQALSFWCMSWMLHLAAIPLLLVGILSGYAGLRALLAIKSSASLAN
jgi:hypothetical protein